MTTNVTPADDLMSPVEPKYPTSGKKLSLQDIVGFQEPYIKRKAEIQKGIAQAGEEEAKGKQEQAEILSMGKKEAQDVYGAAEKQAMGTYKERTEAEPIPAFVPTKDNAQDLASLFSVINVIGMLVGGGGRTNAVNAMAAMDGMAKGYQQGRQDLYKQERDTFEKNYRAMLQKHAEFRKEMEDAIKLAATNKEAGLAAAELAATKAGSSIVKAQIRKGDLLGAYKNVDESQKGAEKALDFIEKEQTRAQNAIDAERRHRETLASQLALKEATLAGKQMDKVLPLTQGVRGVESLLTQLKDPEVRSGLTAKLSPILEKLQSIASDDKNEFESAVTKNLTGTDKTTLFLKDALLETYAIERAAKGGQRLTVQDMKTIGPVLDPTNYKPETYEALLEQRRKSLYNNLGDLGVGPEKVREMSQQRPYTPFSGEATSKPLPNEEKLKAYADAHFGGDVTKAKEYLASQGYK